MLNGNSTQCATCAHKFGEKAKKINQAATVEGTNVLRLKSKTRKNSSTGAVGVSFIKKTGRFRAYINFKRKQYSLGTYDKLDDAIAARKEGEAHIWGDFLEYYKATYPQCYEKIKNYLPDQEKS